MWLPVLRCGQEYVQFLNSVLHGNELWGIADHIHLHFNPLAHVKEVVDQVVNRGRKPEPGLVDVLPVCSRKRLVGYDSSAKPRVRIRWVVVKCQIDVSNTLPGGGGGHMKTWQSPPQFLQLSPSRQ